MIRKITQLFLSVFFVSCGMAKAQTDTHIQNQNGSSQVANFWINGTGKLTRLMINNPTDDGSTILQVNGGISATSGINISQYQPLGQSQGNFVLLSSFKGDCNVSYMYNKLWLKRHVDGANWDSGRLHDGVTIDNSFQTPGVDTKTWWERSPYNDIQSWGNGSQTYLTINKGNIGIGTVNPTVPFEMQIPSYSGAEKVMKVSLSDSSPDYLSIENSTGIDGLFGPCILGNHQTDAVVPSLFLIGKVDASKDTGSSPVMVFDSRQSALKIATRPLFQWKSYGTTYMSMAADGSLGIGTTDTKGNKLAVAGNMIAEQVTVKLKGNWPDYVFSKEYKLPDLQETEQHIKEKGHLPGIPSAEEVKNNGIDLGEMNAKLLQKIEELTLILIEQNKRIEKLSLETKKNSKN